MSEFITWYFGFLDWVGTHPMQSIPLMLFEFCVLYWIYYKFAGESRIFAWVAGAFFMPQNFVMNVSVLSILGLDVPREFACTPRFQRWQKDLGYSLFSPNPQWLCDWRVFLAVRFCAILNTADPRHC